MIRVMISGYLNQISGYLNMISGYLNQISGYEIRYQDILFLEQAHKLGYLDTKFKYPDIACQKVRITAING